jgi:excinuclease ABC subunit A
MSRGRQATGGQWLRVFGARGHNLKGIDAALPLGTLTVVTGVSGSGKSTLVKETLEAALKARLGVIGPAAAPHTSLAGSEFLERVLNVDHSPIGRTPRSTPASYVGLWDAVRRLFAATPEARSRGYGPGRFSFNVRGGRCETCAGQGQIREEMAFLPDVHVLCEECGGKRFGAETLEVKWRGKSIADVLGMTVEEAAGLFATRRELARPLTVLRDLGLGYLQLGQPSPTLSGGEAERIKLAHELAKGTALRGRTLYVLDEPTTGLHMVDVGRLVDVLQRLVERGNTAVVIEHNPEVIKWADWVIDLGPEGGEAGGELVFAGSPRELLEHPTSYTAEAMRHYLAGERLTEQRPTGTD